MESNQAAIGLLIIILLIVGANFVMYAIARGAAPRPGQQEGKSHWLSSLKDTLSKPMDTPANKSLEELRRRVQELEKRKTDNDSIEKRG